MGYRKVGVLEQIWYIIKWKFSRHGKRKDYEESLRGGNQNGK